MQDFSKLDGSIAERLIWTALAHADPDDIVSILLEKGASRRVHLEPGETLIRQGDDGDTVFLLQAGRLEVTRDVEAETAVLAIVDEPGSLLGEMVALGGGERTATVTALESCDLVATGATNFQRLLLEHPDLASGLIAIAVRRAEEGELAELLASHFGILDEDALLSACGAVTWRRLSQGETLIREGAESDSMYFVIRGRLVATRQDPSRGEEIEVGEIARGEAVGEIGLLARTPRSATVRAVRDSVLAELSETDFLALVDRQPRLAIELCLKAVARAQKPETGAALTKIVGVATANQATGTRFAEDLRAELARHGDTRILSPNIVDAALMTPGVSDSRRGDVGDVRVSRMLHEAELDSDYLIVELGDRPGNWSRRALGMVDRILILDNPSAGPDERSRVERLLGECPTGVKRTVVILHSAGHSSPSGTSRIRSRFDATGVVHIAAGSRSDMARLGRVVVGRGNSLVLGGGGGRGFAHIGVIRALAELGFPVDIVGGTSIGGVIAAVAANAMSADEITSWAEQHFPTVLDYTLPLVSLTKGARIARAARATFGDREIEDLWHTYFTMSTDLTTSRSHIHQSGSIALAIRATSAIPGVMPPVPYGEALLIDGGVLNNLPIDVARSKTPSGSIIAVDVAPPRGPGAHGDYGLSVSGWEALRANLKRGRSPFPRLSAVLMRSMITASMQERDNQVRSGLADCYLDLDIRNVSMLDFDDAAGVARRGYEAAMPSLEAWMHSRE